MASAVASRSRAASNRLTVTGGLAASAVLGAGVVNEAAIRVQRCDPDNVVCRNARTQRGASARIMAIDSSASFSWRSRFPFGRNRLGLTGSPAGLLRRFFEPSPEKPKTEADFFFDKCLRSCMMSRNESDGLSISASVRCCQRTRWLALLQKNYFTCARTS